MYNPLISIIIPVYNGANFLKIAIDSALNQTYKNIEVIVVNDGSVDEGETDKIARIFGNKIKYYSKENGGVASALNFGIEKMTGDYFSWLSHDDVYFPNKIQTQILIINEVNDYSSILYGGCEIIDEDSKVIGKFEPHQMHDEKKLNISLYPLFRGLIHGCSLLIPVNYFRIYGNFNESLRHTQDYDLWFKFLKNGSVIYHKDILIQSRNHSSQDSKKGGAFDEGNKLWIDLHMNLNNKEMELISGTVTKFLNDSIKFLSGTYYSDAQKFVVNKLNEHITSIFVSIIIIFSKNIDSLLNAINSVREQGYKNFEIIIVDHGPVEISDILNNILFSDSRVKYYFIGSQSLGSARNFGINLCRGEYINFLNSVDIFLQGKILNQLYFMVKNNLSASFTSYFKTNVSGHVFETVKFNQDLDFPEILSNLDISLSTLMIEKSILDKIIFNEFYEINNDICFLIDISKVCRLSYLNLCLTSVEVDVVSIKLYKRQKTIELVDAIYHLNKFEILDNHRPYLIDLHMKSINFLRTDVELFLFNSIKIFSFFFTGLLLVVLLLEGFKYDFLVFVLLLIYLCFIIFSNRVFIVNFIKKLIKNFKRSKIKLYSFFKIYLKLRYEK